jgi:exodeoxyribonuclease VII large subunit
VEKRYITVSTLNKYLKNKFDTDPNIQHVCLKGEISNFKGHTRGHLYFTLKDDEGRINAVMFSFNASKLTFTPEDGMKVLVEGKVSVYPATGSYQIYVEDMINDGLGNLYLKYEALKKELASKGLFNEDHKKLLPKYPNKIGIVTAPTGAAIKDILSTIKRRYPICETILFPCLVQGELAKDDITKQINEAQKYDLDLLIVGRGGGSIEDLWAFNEEVVAYAIYNSHIPIISAVGHEIDFTIADFVADKRAPTPTGAAEMAVPNMTDLNTYIDSLNIRLNTYIQNEITAKYSHLNDLKTTYVLQNPLAVYEIKEQKLSNLITNLNNNIINRLNIAKTKYNHLKDNYTLTHPEDLLLPYQNSYSLLLNKLELLNPLSVLAKGYSVVTKDNKVIKDQKELKVNDLINIRLNKGNIKAKVEGVE